MGLGQARGAALRPWAILLAATCLTAGFGLAAFDPAPSRWAGFGILVTLVVVGVGQPIRLLSVPLGLILGGLYVASAAALGSTPLSLEFAAVAMVAAVLVALAAEAVGRVCTQDDERRLVETQAVASLTPVDGHAGVLKWQHADPLVQREIARATRLQQQMGFMLVTLDDASHLDRRRPPDALLSSDRHRDVSRTRAVRDRLAGHIA
jgi:hypothetical protein